MRDFYKQLGVIRSASPEDIKRAYRKIAVDHHPDKTNDPAKIERFKEVTEAYNTLSDLEKKWIYDQQLSREESPLPMPPMRVQPEARQQFRPKPKAPPRRSMSERFAGIASVGSLLAFSFCAFLLLDYILPPQVHATNIITKYAHYATSGGNQSHSADIIVTEDGASYLIPVSDSKNFGIGRKIQVYLTRLAEVPRRIANDEHIEAGVPVSIYGNFLVAPLVLLVLSVLGITSRKKVQWRFNLGIICFFILLLNVLFLYSHKLFL